MRYFKYQLLLWLIYLLTFLAVFGIILVRLGVALGILPVTWMALVLD